MPTHYHCKECGAKYYTAASPEHDQREHICEKCGGELKRLERKENKNV